MKKIMNKLFVLMFCLLVTHGTQAALRVEITKGADGAIPIAIVPFQRTGQAFNIDDVSEIITNDLQRSGQFSPIDKNKLVAMPKDLQDVNFKTWRVAGIDHLVIGGVNVIGPDNYELNFRLLDVYKGVQVLGYQFFANKRTLRAMSHRISDLIYEKITGQKGAFETKIAYITALRQAGQQPKYQLQVADTDGYNPQIVLSSTQPIMSPSWSPNGKMLAYVSFEKRRPEIYIQNLYNEQRTKVTAYEGINGAPVWSPDGRKLALTLSKSGNPDIYTLDVVTKKLTQVTRHWAIDTEPTWTPDGRDILFTSGRSGKPQIYRIPANGGQAKRVTYEGNYNTSPEVSADGRKLAFVQGEGNVFKVAIMDLETGYVEPLTDGPLDESPSFAPNGSMILYASTDNYRGVLSAVSSDGRFSQKLVLSEGDVREPTWGPFRQ